jgi:Leucine-rich repeat (LRR) protein
VLSTTLGRLRRLRVVELKQVSQLAHLGRLLAGTTQLTQLVMLWDGGVTLSGGQLLEGLKAAAAGPGTTAAAAAASTLPPLRHLEVEGLFDGLLPAWLECPQAAAHFTTLKRTKWAAVIAELRHLPACSGLQELVVQYLPKHIPGLPQDLTRLTALTRLELIGMPIKEIPPVVWGLTSLRQLEIYWEGAAISSDISQLRQLRSLSLEGGEVKQLPADLGTWLPHLEELNMSNMRYASPVPRDVTRLTRLTANYTKIRRVSALTHLVTLKELEIEGCRLRPPLQPLTRLSALETLVLGWAAVVEEWEFALSRQEAEQVCVPALPALRSLRLSGWVPRRADQLSAVAQQLTHLKLYASLRPGVAAALEQLGVMPQLQQLELGAMSLECGGCYFDSLPPAAAQWLQQQPALTRLKLVSCKLAGPHLLQLPGQLEELDIERSRLVEPTPAALPQLSRLHKLTLYTRDHQQLPPWLSSLSRLEELSVQCSQDTTGWEVLGQLPALRRLRAVDFSPHKLSLVKHALPHVPHLCWSPA